MSGPEGMARAQFGDGGSGCGVRSSALAGPTRLTEPSSALTKIDALDTFMTSSLSLYLVGSLRCGRLLHVRQHPFLLEELFSWRVEARHQFELACGIGWQPVRVLAGRRCGAE